MHSASSQSPLSPIEPIYRLYAALVRALPFDGQSGLGGKLLYCGELSDPGRTLLYAANIAGAASLGASADPAIQRQAMRDGVIDFLVTSLEEALRILKNEVRKRQPVSVGVAAAPYRLAEQMLERGVLPDLLPSASTESSPAFDSAQAGRFLAQGARQIQNSSDPLGREAERGTFVAWSIAPTDAAVHPVARWLPQIDACALSVLPAGDGVRQRWLRLAPRYLGRMAQRQRGIAFTVKELARFRSEVDEWIARLRNESGERATVTILESEG